ncbi:MAG TPA: hypothetical protein VHM70_09925 [Polyangiaceae bacterium]|nr:hypothetical protein [Polyangiaceae bacterium]
MKSSNCQALWPSLVQRSVCVSSAVSALCVLALVACGETEPARSPQAASPSEADSEARVVQTANEKVPSRCVVRKGACMPPIQWAERLCQNGVYQDLALYMFRAGTPWTRFYMRTGLNAVNGWGPTVAEDLVSQEEVIPINYRRQNETFQVEGSLGTFDVLRWNGSCVTLDVGEVTSVEPSRPKHSRVEWKALSDSMQEALLTDEEVNSVYNARRRECKGASIGRVTKDCEILDGKLVDVIAEHVRRVHTLPEPKETP